MHIKSLTKNQVPVRAESEPSYVGTWTGLMLFILGSIFVPAKFF